MTTRRSIKNVRKGVEQRKQGVSIVSSHPSILSVQVSSRMLHIKTMCRVCCCQSEYVIKQGLRITLRYHTRCRKHHRGSRNRCTKEHAPLPAKKTNTSPPHIVKMSTQKEGGNGVADNATPLPHVSTPIKKRKRVFSFRPCYRNRIRLFSCHPHPHHFLR